MVVQASAAGQPCSLLGYKMASDGGGMRHLNAPFRAASDSVKALGSAEEASRLGSYANVFMNGGEVFKFAVRAVPTVSADFLCRVIITLTQTSYHSYTETALHDHEWRRGCQICRARRAPGEWHHEADGIGVKSRSLGRKRAHQITVPQVARHLQASRQRGGTQPDHRGCGLRARCSVPVPPPALCVQLVMEQN